MFNQSPNKLIRHPEHGLLIPVHAKVRGKFKISAFDADGRPQLLRTPGGDIIQPLEGPEHSNLITDSGLDAIAVKDPLATDASTSGMLGWRAQLAIGTGSTAPGFTDTALANEVQRASSTGSFSSPDNVGELDAVKNVWRATSTVVRVVELSQARNLTEFGFFQGAGTPINIRELIRNASGDPIPVSLGEGLFFRVDHSMIVEISAPADGFFDSLSIEEFDAGGNLEDTLTFDVQWGLRARNLSSVSIVGASSSSGGAVPSIFEAWRPVGAAPNARVVRATQVQDYERVDDWSTASGWAPASASLIQPPYVPGSYSRIKRWQLGAGTLNGAWHGYALGVSQSGASPFGAGLQVSFLGGSSYAKLNTTTMRVGYISTWGRG